MANQQELSDFIKKVHIDLRVTSRKVGPDVAWEEHCKKDDMLQKYAQNMRDLAIIHWDKNIIDAQKVNRINWVVCECNNYFSLEMQKQRLRMEQKLAYKYFNEIINIDDNRLRKNEKLNLLDVGSCYNPFESFSQFDVTAIDLSPAVPQVLRCDFLKVMVGDMFEMKAGSVHSLPRQHYHVIVFSLLLEYLPHPSFRYDCCLKAYDLLEPGGVFIIITPDSKHPSANSKIIKNWRVSLAQIGFLKVTYQKSEHLHCMSYTKCFDSRIPRKWLSLKHLEGDIREEMMVIPQDTCPYNEYESAGELYSSQCHNRCESDNKYLADNFSALAGDELFLE